MNTRFMHQRGSGSDRGEVVVLMGQPRGVYTDRHNKREDLPCGAATY
jgi:hypothetical protein